MSELPADALRTCESDLSVLETVETARPGPTGSLPLEPADLLQRPSGDIFGWTLDVGMGWKPDALKRPEVLILSTQGGIRENDGSPLALGYHTGHWEVGLLMRAAAEELRAAACMPFAGFVTDPCDGRTQGTTGMMDSLPYRNDAAMVLGRLIRSLPTRVGVIGVATCDKGLPAMMMAVAGAHGLPGVIVPGGVTLPATRVVVARRSDGSGTTENFTKYLTLAAGQAWTLKSGSTVEWPADTQAGNGNSGVAQIVKSKAGAIGYVDLSDAKASGLTYAAIKNAAGTYVAPTLEATSAAGDGVEVADNLLFSALDSKAPAAYPITAQSWCMLYAQQADKAKGTAAVAYFRYMLTDGQKLLPEIDFAPIPKSLQDKALAQLDKVQVP